MKALVKEKSGFNQMVLKDVVKPIPQGDEVLIQVAYTGICGTDIHGYKGDYDRLVPPIILGHEFSGIVAAVGEFVTNCQIGDRVTSETTFATCEKCENCRKKEYNLCRNRSGIGTQVNGSFAEYVLTREESVHVLPDSISLLEASITEPIACGVHAALEKVQVRTGDWVVIIGPGPIGLCLAQVVKGQSAQVILLGITQDKERLKLGLGLGVDYVIDTQNENAVELVLALTNGEGADYCFECSGAAAVLPTIFDVLKQKGTLIQMGVFGQNVNPLDMNSIVQREITVVGSRSQKPSSWNKTLELMGAKKIDSKKLITKIEPLSNWQGAIDSVIAGNEIKVLLQPNQISD